VNDCLNWSDGKYVPYEPADYAALVPTWFDDADPHQAEIFWTIAHAKAESSRLEPQWFPISPVFFSEQPERKLNRHEVQANRQGMAQRQCFSEIRDSCRGRWSTGDPMGESPAGMRLGNSP